jgi:hypothetical protein
MASAAPQPAHLRLVGADDPQALEQWRATRRAREDVIRENRLAAAQPPLEPTDPRWVLAAKTYAHLQGATLTPERRERLMGVARKLGLRAFDANLVIAVVQDHARRGERPADAVPALRMIEGRPARSAAIEWMRWIAALLCAVAINVFLVWWLTAR